MLKTDPAAPTALLWRIASLLGRGVSLAIFLVLDTIRPLLYWSARIVRLVCLLCGIGYGCLKGWTSQPCLSLLGFSLLIAALLLLSEFIPAKSAPESLDEYW